MSKRANEQTLLELQRENQVLASKILELESEAVETDVYRKEMRKRIAELEQSGKEL